MVEWIAARDVALLSCFMARALRISEGLSFQRGDTPLGEAITVLGKGKKMRIVPLLPAVREAVATYTAVVPFAGRPHDPAVPVADGKADGPARGARFDASICAPVSALSDRATPDALRHSFATISWPMAASCARCRNCLATPRFRPPDYTEIDVGKLMDVYAKRAPALQNHALILGHPYGILRLGCALHARPDGRAQQWNSRK